MSEVYIERRKARDGTKRLPSSELRKRVKKAAEKRFDDPILLTKLDALLTRSEKLTEKRNRLIHDITYHTKSGEFVLKEDNEPHRPYPSAEELNKITDEVLLVAADLRRANHWG